MSFRGGSIRQHRASRSSERGIGLVPVLFLVVALAALGAAVVRFSATQHLTHAYDLLGSQVLAAARAGIHWGTMRANAGSCVSSSTFSGDPHFPGITLTVTCTQSGPLADEGKTITIYRLTATARTAGSPGSHGYVERQVTAAVVKES